MNTVNNNLQSRLDFVYLFQQKFPNSHLGGSLGLYLYGINLQRDLSYSDCDMVIRAWPLSSKAHFEEEVSDMPNIKVDTHHIRSSDFNFSLRFTPSVNSVILSDIRYSTEPSFNTVFNEGRIYNVSTVQDIIHWKIVYMLKGSVKHYEDLKVLQTSRQLRKSLDTKYITDLLRKFSLFM